MKDGRFITMAFESSCDETSVAVLEDGRKVLSNVISSQIDIFKQYGGVVPEIASRHHLENINTVIEEAMSQAEVGWQHIDLIGVTYGPGLVGALLMGVATAKAVAFAHDIPLVGVHHIIGHICANFIEYPDLEPPFMALVTSGGHTNIIEMEDYNRCRVLGATRDDAVGEAYDKVARVLGLGYPGGPKMDALAKSGNPAAINFKRVYLEAGSLDFSFSGLKTAVLNYLNHEKQAGRQINKADVAASFQQAVMDVIVDKTMEAVTGSQYNKLALAGGVAANSRLRAMLEEACRQKDVELYRPAPILCTDNGAMIGCAAYYKYHEMGADSLDMDAYPNLPL
ncbi:MAG: tRNA (adenosine(37)-N6)-threonylcarbamoyltransferase complex transferase subunit TsaD [Firmicutes bacterium]|nr:tRNA (adenosine(37)-N6)-threonylcarbamoyltransferase complex transferase subunit TsaD [Bacillota bacterium]